MTSITESDLVELVQDWRDTFERLSKKEGRPRHNCYDGYWQVYNTRYENDFGAGGLEISRIPRFAAVDKNGFAHSSALNYARATLRVLGRPLFGDSGERLQIHLEDEQVASARVCYWQGHQQADFDIRDLPNHDLTRTIRLYEGAQKLRQRQETKLIPLKNNK